MYHSSIKLAFGNDSHYPIMTEEKKDGSIVLPQREYQKLFNRQYAELTTLKKKVDPEKRHEACLETTLKQHYPDMYHNMLKHDYITTGSDQTGDALDNAVSRKERQRINMQMTKQLDNVISGRQKTTRLSNPI